MNKDEKEQFLRIFPLLPKMELPKFDLPAIWPRLLHFTAPIMMMSSRELMIGLAKQSMRNQMDKETVDDILALRTTNPERGWNIVWMRMLRMTPDITIEEIRLAYEAYWGKESNE